VGPVALAKLTRSDIRHVLHPILHSVRPQCPPPVSATSVRPHRSPERRVHTFHE
jgi:hypothetical protein